MSFEVNPILEPGQKPEKRTWYAIADESPSSSSCDQQDRRASPGPRVGSCANYYLPAPPSSVGAREAAGETAGRVLLSAGATPEGPYSDLYQLSIGNGLIALFDLKEKDYFFFAVIQMQSSGHPCLRRDFPLVMSMRPLFAHPPKQLPH